MASQNRIAICGGPRCGKTTLATRLHTLLGYELISCDDFIGMGWSESSAYIADQLLAADRFIVEGVQVGRALRKMLTRDPTRKPVDMIRVLNDPWVEQTRGQVVMAKGCRSVFAEIEPKLRALGVAIIG